MAARFEKISSYKDKEFPMPVRQTKLSAGYDFSVVEDIVIPSIYVQMFNMLKGHLTNPDFINRVADLKVVKILISLGADKVAKLSDKAKKDIVKLLIENEMPEVMQFLSEEMTIDLEDMRNLTKETNTRMTLVPTGIKVALEENQKMELMMRSSSSMGAYLMLANGVGLIDADYYDNPDNEGHIFFQIVNMSPYNIRLKKGDIIGQGVISTYDKTVDDISNSSRDGGLGSTTVKK